MKPKSAKAKGRKWQQVVRDEFRTVAEISNLGLKPEDIESRSMGQAGSDIIFSPAAKLEFDYDVECKAQERLDVSKAFEQAANRVYNNRENDIVLSTPLLFHTKNRGRQLVTLEMSEFFDLLIAIKDLRFLLERKVG